MRYLKKRRRVIGKEVDLHQEDPMSWVANLFDGAAGVLSDLANREDSIQYFLTFAEVITTLTALNQWEIMNERTSLSLYWM